MELGPKESDIEVTLNRLQSLHRATFPHADLIPVFEKLLNNQRFREQVEWLLKTMWGELAFQYRFWGFGDKQDLLRIEALLERLGTPPRNELP